MNAEDEKRLRELHAEGLWDNEIARRMHISAPTVKRWRNILGLAQNEFDRSSRNLEPVYVDGARARELYDAGLSDWEIGLELGVDVGQVLKWRRGEHLQPNNPRDVGASLDAAIRERYGNGLTDHAIASELDISPDTVRNWRLREGLRANSHARIDEARAMEMYQDGASDTQIAHALGATAGGIRGWRQRNDLSPNHELCIVPDDYDWTNVDAQIRKGVPDSEIAKEAELSRHAVRKRRAALDLKRTRGGQRKFADDDAKRLYARGLIDREIAAELNVTLGTVMRWRHRNKLPPNGRRS